jgi:hypothetical protein
MWSEQLIIIVVKPILSYQTISLMRNQKFQSCFRYKIGFSSIDLFIARVKHEFYGYRHLHSNKRPTASS